MPDNRGFFQCFKTDPLDFVPDAHDEKRFLFANIARLEYLIRRENSTHPDNLSGWLLIWIHGSFFSFLRRFLCREF